VAHRINKRGAAMWSLSGEKRTWRGYRKSVVPEAFVNTFQGVNMAAIRKGIPDVGIKDNEIGMFSELMDAKSLFLTANADTVYFFGFIDLTKGPMVFEPPPKALGVLDDFWWRWVIDIGLPGPDRGEGGKYLLLPPGYDGPLPEGGYFVARSRTTRVVILGRLFMENNDPKPAADLIKKATKIYPYETGGVGTSVAEFLSGEVKLARPSVPPPMVFHDVSGKVMNTIPPNDFSYYEMLNEVVQQEPATSLDPELMGSLAAIGIVKGKPFAPDDRMKKILTEAELIRDVFLVILKIARQHDHVIEKRPHAFTNEQTSLSLAFAFRVLFLTSLSWIMG
jgi:hypothetical protein